MDDLFPDGEIKKLLTRELNGRKKGIGKNYGKATAV